MEERWGCKEMWGKVWESVLGCGGGVLEWRILGVMENVGRGEGKVWGE